MRRLVRLSVHERPDVQELLEVVVAGLGRTLDLREASVFAGADGSGPRVGHVRRAPGPAHRSAGAWTRRVVVRHRGDDLGVLVLVGAEVDRLRPQVLEAVLIHLGGGLRARHVADQRRASEHVAAATRQLFGEGAAATSVEVAAQVLARVTGAALRAERAALQLVDDAGRIRHTVGVGLPPDVDARLARRLVGLEAQGSPVWREATRTGEPILVDDLTGTSVRPGGLLETLGVGSYVALPLLCDGEVLGVAVCGDTGPRRWTDAERDLARRLALEGSLVLENARMRQAERDRMSELTRQAFYDSLTGLPNRSLLHERLEAALEPGARPGRTSVLVLDLDGFKEVNDTLGHAAGDTLLQKVGARLVGAVRERDTVARLGGDEFAVMLSGDADDATTDAVAHRVHERLGQPFAVAGTTVRISASVGIATAPDHADDVAGLLRAADAAMYSAKRDGGGPRRAVR